MPEPMVHIGDYSLRPMTAGDRDSVRDWRNREHVRHYMFDTGIITAEDHARWFEDTLSRDDKDYQVVLYKDVPVGLANATAIDTAQHSCEWGFYIADSEAPKGSGTCMATLMLDHIFSAHDVETVTAEVLEYNTASIRLHEKLGFGRDADNDRVHESGGEQYKVLAYRLSRQDWSH